MNYKRFTVGGTLILLSLIASALAQTDDQPVRRRRRVNRHFSADDALEVAEMVSDPELRDALVKHSLIAA